MTTDEAATLLATYELTGSVSETARQLGKNKGTVSRLLRKAGATVADPLQPSTTKTNWAAAFGQRERKVLAIIDDKMPAASFRDLTIFFGVADDKRYREEHPESVRGNVVNIDNRAVHIDTAEALAALRAAKTELLTDGNPDQDH